MIDFGIIYVFIHETPLGCVCGHTRQCARGESFLCGCWHECLHGTAEVALPLSPALVEVQLQYCIVFGPCGWRKTWDNQEKWRGQQSGRSRKRTELQGKVDWIAVIQTEGKSLKWGWWQSHKSWWKGRRIFSFSHLCEAGLEIMNLNHQKNQFGLDVS